MVQNRGVKLIFTGDHISLAVALKGPSVILGPYKCNYSLTVKRELGAATGQKHGAGPDKIVWRAGFGSQALCLPPVVQNDAVPFSRVKDLGLPAQMDADGLSLRMLSSSLHATTADSVWTVVWRKSREIKTERDKVRGFIFPDCDEEHPAASWSWWKTV